MLTPRLLRMEYSRAGAFEDRASQAFWYRRQPVPKFDARQTSELIEIETEYLQLRYRVSDEGFASTTLSIQLKASGVTWRFGDRDRLTCAARRGRWTRQTAKCGSSKA